MSETSSGVAEPKNPVAVLTKSALAARLSWQLRIFSSSESRGVSRITLTIAPLPWATSATAMMSFRTPWRSPDLSAQTDGFSSFKTLDSRVVGAQRKADGGGNLYRSPVQHGDSQADPPGIYADRGKAEAGCFLAQTHNLIGSGL